MIHLIKHLLVLVCVSNSVFSMDKFTIPMQSLQENEYRNHLPQEISDKLTIMELPIATTASITEVLTKAIAPIESRLSSLEFKVKKDEHKLDVFGRALGQTMIEADAMQDQLVECNSKINLSEQKKSLDLDYTKIWRCNFFTALEEPWLFFEKNKLAKEQLPNILTDIEKHLQNGFDPNFLKDWDSLASNDNIRPIEIALNKYHFPHAPIVLNKLIKYGADVNVKNFYSQETPLHTAARLKTPEAIKFLVAAGACINAKNKYGNTPLYEAVNLNNVKNVRELLVYGPDINTLNNEKKTPLARAVINGDIEIVKELLAHGADVTTKIGNGETVLDIFRESHPIQQVLQEYKLKSRYCSIQ